MTTKKLLLVLMLGAAACGTTPKTAPVTRTAEVTRTVASPSPLTPAAEDCGCRVH